MLADLETHVTSILSMTIGTRDADLQPHFARAAAVRLGPGDRELTVLVSSVLATDTVADLRDNGRLAVSLNNMATFHARQVKGTLVRIADADEADEAFILAARDRICEWVTKNLGPSVATMLAAIPARPALAITMAMTDVFDQTPRRGAGARLA